MFHKSGFITTCQGKGFALYLFPFSNFLSCCCFLILILNELVSRAWLANDTVTVYVINVLHWTFYPNNNRKWSQYLLFFLVAYLLCPGCFYLYWFVHCTVFHTCCLYRTIIPCVWPWDFRKHFVCECVCADSAACHWATWLLSCVFTDFTDLRTQQPGDLQTWGREGRGGREDGRVTYRMMLPLLHNPFQRGESAEEAVEQNNWRKREKEKRLPSV